MKTTLFVCLLGKFLQMKNIDESRTRKIEKKEREYFLKVFVNNSPILPLLFLFLFASYEIHKLFLFLFLQKLAQQIYSYSYLRGKKTISWTLIYMLHNNAFLIWPLPEKASHGHCVILYGGKWYTSNWTDKSIHVCNAWSATVCSCLDSLQLSEVVLTVWNCLH